jgi:hypothetical protein
MWKLSDHLKLHYFDVNIDKRKKKKEKEKEANSNSLCSFKIF